MNLLNKELLGIAAAIAVLFTIQQLLPKKKEGFLDASQSGVVVGGIVLLVLVTIGFGYASYQIKD